MKVVIAMNTQRSRRSIEFTKDKMNNLSMWTRFLFVTVLYSSFGVEAELSDLGMPSFVFFLEIANPHFNQKVFQIDLEITIKDHLEKALISDLPSTGVISKDAFQNITLKSQLTQIDSTLRDGEMVSVFQASFSGALHFESQDQLSVTGDYSTTFKNIFTTAFQGESYWALVGDFVADDVLMIIEDVQINIGGRTIVLGEVQELQGGGNNSPVSPALTSTTAGASPANQDASSSHKGLAIAAAVVFGVMSSMMTCIVIYLYVDRRKKHRRKKKSQRNDENQDDNDGAEENTDSWLDEWTRKITSIPLRQPITKPTQPKVLPHPAKRQQLKNFLFCIAEEDDVIEEVEQPSFVKAEGDDCILEDIDLDIPRQFDDVDAASPSDYEPRVINNSMVYL